MNWLSVHAFCKCPSNQMMRSYGTIELVLIDKELLNQNAFEKGHSKPNFLKKFMSKVNYT